MPTANGRINERNRCSRKLNCGLSISMLWFSSVIADVVLGLLSCVPVCETSRTPLPLPATEFAPMRSI